MTTSEFIKSLKMILAENVERFEINLENGNVRFDIYSSTSSIYHVKLTVDENEGDIRIITKYLETSLNTVNIEELGYGNSSRNEFILIFLDNSDSTKIYL